MTSQPQQPTGAQPTPTTGRAPDEVRKLFDDMIAEGLHPGAQVAVYRDGKLEIDLYAGLDGPSGKPVTADNLFQMRSCTKALAATVMLLLHDRGRFSFDDLVTRYWPEFGQGGKEKITIAEVMGHRAGIPDGQALAPDQWGNREAMAKAIEVMTPIWEPGTANGYHAATYGMILDEIVLRIENRTISSILRDEFTAPLGIEDLYLGLPRELLPRMTQMANIDPISDARKRTSDAINNGSLATLPMAWISGMATARAAANLMNVLAYEGSYQGHKLFSRETLVKARTPTNAPGEVDRRLLRPIRWGLGYILGDTPDIYGVAPHALAAGHAGGGASVIWGDPERRLAVAFLCNGMLAGGREWDRYRRMGEAIYSTVGK